MIRRNKGLEAKYHTVYRAMKKITGKSMLDEVEEYCLIKPYLEWQKTNNPGTFVAIRSTVNNTYEYSFIAPSVAVEAFKYVLPLIAIDACHTRGTYK